MILLLMKRLIIISFIFCIAGVSATAQIGSKISKVLESPMSKGVLAKGVAQAQRKLQDATKRTTGSYQKTMDLTKLATVASPYNKHLAEAASKMAHASEATVKPPQFKNIIMPIGDNLKHKVSKEKMLERFLSYVRIESQSIDEPDMNSFPMSDGQKEIARYIYNEVKAFGGKDVKVTLSDDYYVYLDIPSNIKKEVPSILFMAHMDVTPEAPGSGIKPIVHRNYDGGDLHLPGGITLSPNSPQGAHLKDLTGKTIVTSDGTTLLGADDKTGCAVLITMVEELIKNPKLKHGRVMVALSQNEDIGKAAMRYDTKVFGNKPDVVIDLDGDTYNKFSIANFSAIGQSYLFKGNKAHASHGKASGYADALSAAAYFIGLVPPKMNPGVRDGKDGYIHCYSMYQPDSDANNYVVKTRLRYFDPKEGEYQKQLMEDNLQKTKEAFPLVECIKTDDQMQYDNIALTMPKYVPELVLKAAFATGMLLTPRSERGGTTSAMMVSSFPDAMPGGCGVYSGQNAEHSVYEWCCIEELVQLVHFTERLITEVTNLK